MNRLLFRYIALVLLFAWYACAQITPLTGGEKDITPPQVIKTIPGNNSTLVSPKKIYVEFDEFIKLNNIHKQFLSSPALKNTPKFKLKGKTLIIELSDTLLPNTTYTFSFGNSIVDITENNPAENFQYVFSTGKYIDSLEISGNVVDAYTLKPDEKIFVLLYPNLSDTFFKTRPSYVGLTQKDGSFTIKHIKNGNYRLLALKDINNNYVYDLPGEKIGFLPEVLSVDSNRNDLHIRTYVAEDCMPKIKKTKQLESGAFLIETENIQRNDFEAKMLYPNSPYTVYKNGDSLLIVAQNLNKNDSVSLFIYNNQFADTISYRYMPPKDSSVQISLIKTKSVIPEPKFTFTSFLPFTVDSSKVILLKDSMPEKFYAVKKTQNRWQISINNAEQRVYKLYFLPGAIKNFYNKANQDTLRFDLSVQDAANFGNLKVTVNPAFDSPYFIILKDKSQKEVLRTKTYTGKAEVDFKYLTPNSYSLYCVLDEDKNNLWDCGDVLNNRQPERVIGYKNNPVKILQNWEQETEWNIMP